MRKYERAELSVPSKPPFGNRMRDELLEEWQFMSRAHARIVIAEGSP